MAAANPQLSHKGRLDISSLYLLHSFPYQSVPLLTYFFSAVQQIPHERYVHVPPPWPITYTHFYTGDQFCGFLVGFRHFGVHRDCQVSVAGKLLSKLSSFTPRTEDPQDLTQQVALAGRQPSHFIGMWYNTTATPLVHMGWQRHVRLYSYVLQCEIHQGLLFLQTVWIIWAGVPKAEKLQAILHLLSTSWCKSNVSVSGPLGFLQMEADILITNPRECWWSRGAAARLFTCVEQL